MTRIAAMAVLAATSLFAQPGLVMKNWVVEIDTPEDIYAVGDPHADYERLTSVLRSAKVVDGSGKWMAGKAVLVITGDTIDKGPEQVKTISYIRTLQLEADKAGGRVVLTLGNHEAEFLADPKGKKTREFADALQAKGMKPKDVADCGEDLGRFLCSLPVAVRVNDWFFSHGGYTAGRSIREINEAVSKGFASQGYQSDQFVGDDSILEARLSEKGPGGVPWFQGGDPKGDPAKVLAGFAAKLGVRHIVQGHQPGKIQFPDGVVRNKEDLFQRYGLLFLTDGAMSSGIEGSTGTGGAIHITATSATAICANGKDALQLWPAPAGRDTASIHCGAAKP